MLVGMGYDVHRLAAGETLVLGGVTIPCEFGTVAHSDGDVLLHALCDAILGTLALGDIGEHFPDTDPQYRGVSSDRFVRRAAELVGEAGYRIVNVDATLILQAPKILAFKAEMRRRIAEMCAVPFERVSLKATTNEHIGFAGRGEGVAAMCVCLVAPLTDSVRS